MNKTLIRLNTQAPNMKKRGIRIEKPEAGSSWSAEPPLQKVSLNPVFKFLLWMSYVLSAIALYLTFHAKAA